MSLATLILSLSLPMTPCPATPVHYEAGGIHGAPWVSAKHGVRASLLYYLAALSDRNVNQASGAVIYRDRRQPLDPPMTIAWSVPAPFHGRLVLVGERLDARGGFRQVVGYVKRGGRIASNVRIPAVGCWRLTVHAAKARASFVATVVDPPATFSCDATPIRRDAPDPIGRTMPWLVATPASAGVTGTIFYQLPANVTVATIYPNKTAPNNGNTKILWKFATRTAGLSLIVLARRLDAPGGLPAQRFGIASDNSPGISFPSGIDVSSTGCWLLILRSGRASGIVVMRSVALR